MDILTLRAVLESAWCAKTSYYPLGYVGDIATGQCAVTALAVQHFLGGDIMTGVALVPYYGKVYGREKHFWNKINDIDVDLTWRQFPRGTTLVRIKKRDRKSLLSNKNLKKRYTLLLKKIDI